MVEQRPRILVVEDETLIALYLQEILDELGCEVVGPVTQMRRHSIRPGTVCSTLPFSTS